MKAAETRGETNEGGTLTRWRAACAATHESVLAHAPGEIVGAVTNERVTAPAECPGRPVVIYPSKGGKVLTGRREEEGEHPTEFIWGWDVTNDSGGFPVMSDLHRASVTLTDAGSVLNLIPQAL